MTKYYVVIVIDIAIVIFGYFAIGKIAEKQLETVRRCEDAEPIIEMRVNCRITLCVTGFLFLLCMVRAIVQVG